MTTTTPATHSPLPWFTGEWELTKTSMKVYWGDPDQWSRVCDCEMNDSRRTYGVEEANARLIVTAVNHHAELVAVLKKLATDVGELLIEADGDPRNINADDDPEAPWNQMKCSQDYAFAVLAAIEKGA